MNGVRCTVLKPGINPVDEECLIASAADNRKNNDKIVRKRMDWVDCMALSFKLCADLVNDGVEGGTAGVILCRAKEYP